MWNDAVVTGEDALFGGYGIEPVAARIAEHNATLGLVFHVQHRGVQAQPYRVAAPVFRLFRVYTLLAIVLSITAQRFGTETSQ